MNQFLGTLALLPLEKILNTMISRDAHVADSMSKFDSKAIEIISYRPDFSLTVRFDDATIHLSAIDSETLNTIPDASIRASAETLLGLLVKSPEQRALANADLNISGDATLVQEFQMTIDSLDIEWQDLLAPVLGDVLSNGLGEAERAAREWGNSANKNLQRNIRDYLSEEAKLVPSRLEIDSFSDRLDQLRLGVDRMSARTELLQRRLSLLTTAK